MNDDLDINLPADADDLSKHAPALFKLKGTEEGFVVPALYFSQGDSFGGGMSERVIALTSIPVDGGLVVPENYFEESVELISSLSALGSARSDNANQETFVAPENYFEELPSIIEAKTNLPTEDGLIVPEKYFEEFSANLESQIALENMLLKTEGEIPAGYFDQMENELHVHIALDNVKQDEGFVVPEGYFENLADKVVAASVVDLDSARSDNLQDPNVPAGYFDSLGDKVVARIENENREERGTIIVLSHWKKYTAITAVAAAVALIIVVAYTFVSNSDNGSDTLAFRPNTKNLVPDDYVNKDQRNVIDTNSSIIIPVPQKTNPQLANYPKEIKPKQENQVIDEIIAQSDLMDETLVMDFVSVNNVVEPTEEVLDPAMMEYLMNNNSSLDVFDPGDKK